MKKFNWNEVEEATSIEWLPQGGYVVKITDVEDRPDWETLIITFDVAEGPQAGKFKNMPADMNWSHQFRQGYSDRAQRFFKGFLTALEKSNPGFSVDKWQVNSDEKDLAGLQVGVVLNYYHYVNEKGIAVKKYNCARTLPVDKIRSGDFKVPDDTWSDEAKALEEEATSANESTSPAQLDCPF